MPLFCSEFLKDFPFQSELKLHSPQVTCVTLKICFSISSLTSPLTAFPPCSLCSTHTVSLLIVTLQAQSCWRALSASPKLPQILLLSCHPLREVSAGLQRCRAPALPILLPLFSHFFVFVISHNNSACLWVVEGIRWVNTCKVLSITKISLQFIWYYCYTASSFGEIPECFVLLIAVAAVPEGYLTLGHGLIFLPASQCGRKRMWGVLFFGNLFSGEFLIHWLLWENWEEGPGTFAHVSFSHVVFSCIQVLEH